MGSIEPGTNPDSDYDVIVCGAGPSGSSCAAFLSDARLKVLLIDKATFPREKTCGDAISDKSYSLLSKLGISKQVALKAKSPFSAIILSSPSGASIRMELPSRDGLPPGFVLPRELFDNIVFKNAKSKAFVTAIEGAEAIDVIRDSLSGFVNGVAVKMPDGSEKKFACKILVGADGANSVIAHKLGFAVNDEKHRSIAVRQYWSGVKCQQDAIELHFLKSVLPGYFWIFPMSGGIVNVGIGMVSRDVKNGKINMEELLGRIIKTELSISGRFAQAKPAGPLRGWTLPLASMHRKNCADGALLIGDAAGLVDPFTGEGVGNALTSGLIASQVISDAFRAGDYSSKSLSGFDKRIWKEIGAEVHESYFIQKAIRNSFLLNTAIGNASRNPNSRAVLSDLFFNAEPEKAKRGILDCARLLIPF